ncbi:MAG: serine hydrolase [Polyangiaceae bacterium]|nr:serine hydrolase [Polyangiaceae bacterium]
MTAPHTRRRFLLGASSMLSVACSASKSSLPAAPRLEPSRSLADIEASIGGRLGVFAVDTSSGRELAHRADERFAMCSTFKWVLAAAILADVDRGKLALDQPTCSSRRYVGPRT